MSDGKVILETGLNNSGIEKGLAKMGSVVKNGVATAAKLSVAAIAGVTAAVGTIGVAAATVGKQFETAMAKTSTMFGDVQVNTQGLEQKVLALSDATGIAADQIGGSLYNALSAGIPVTEDMGKSMDYMQRNAKLAKAGFTDIDTSVVATAKVLNAYKMDVSETDRVHKVLMQTQNKGITTVGELGAVLAQVTPTAAAMNVSFEQVGAALASMTAQGTPTAQATTMLNSLFAELGKQGTSAQKSLAEATKGTEYAGKSFQDLMKDGVPLNKVLDLMDQSAQANGKSLLDMFGSLEAGKAALSLCGQNTEQFTGNLAAMSTETDVVGNAYDKVMDTFEEKSKTAITNLKNLGIAIYGGMEEPLKTAAETGIEYIGKLSDAFESGGLDGLVSTAGEVFADMAVKIAEQEPQMIDAAVGFIESFATGIKDNAPQLIDAGGNIVKALADGFVKLLPSEIQEPIQQTIETLTQSLKNGGLNDGIKQIGNVISNTGQIISKTTTVVLPPFSKAIDFLGGNLEVIIPLVAMVATGMKAWSIFSTTQKIVKSATIAIAACGAAESATALATATSTGAIAVKQVAVGVLTGKIGFATAAQWAWNTAMSANPIGLVAAAIGALTLVVGGLTLSLFNEESAAKRAKDQQEEFGRVCSNVMENVSEFKQEIASAGTIFDGMNESIVVSQEEQDNLAKKMGEVQGEITQIAKTAAEERRDYTQTEIDRLDELFKKMHELAKLEVEQQKSYLRFVKSTAEDLKNNSDISAEQYVQESQTIINSAEERKKDLIQKAEEQSREEYALAEKAYGENGALNKKAFDDAIAAAKKNKADTIKTTQETILDTYIILQDGLLQKSTSIQKYVSSVKEHNDQEQKETDLHNAEMARLSKAYILASGAGEKSQILVDAAKEQEKYSNEITDIRQKESDDLKNTTQEDITALITYANFIIDNGGQISGEVASTVESMAQSYDSMSDAAKTEFDKLIKTLNLKVEDINGTKRLVYASGEKAGQAFVDGLADVNVGGAIGQTSEDIRLKFEDMHRIVSEMATRLGAAGVQVSTSLTTSIATSAPGVQQAVIDLLGSINSGTQAKESELKTLFENLGLAVPNSLIQSIATQAPNVQMGTIDMLSQLSSGASLQQGELKTVFSNCGIEVSDSLITSLQNARPDLQLKAIDLLNQLKDAPESERAGILSELDKLGTEVGTELTGSAQQSIDAGKGDVAEATKGIADAAGTALDESEASTEASTWGRDFISGLAKGIRGASGLVSSAVSSIADTIKSWLHFSRPDVGPLHYYEEWMPDFMAGLARGISDSKGLVIDEIGVLASNVRENMDGMDSSISVGVDTTGIPTDILRQIRSLGEQGISELTARAKAAVRIEIGKISAVADTYMTRQVDSYIDFSGIADAVKQGLSGAKVEANGRQIGEVVFENWDRVVRTHGGR